MLVDLTSIPAIIITSAATITAITTLYGVLSKIKQHFEKQTEQRIIKIFEKLGEPLSSKRNAQIEELNSNLSDLNTTLTSSIESLETMMRELMEQQEFLDNNLGEVEDQLDEHHQLIEEHSTRLIEIERKIK